MNEQPPFSPDELELERARLKKIVDEPSPGGSNSRVWSYFQQQARAHLARLNRGCLPTGIEDHEIPY